MIGFFLYFLVVYFVLVIFDWFQENHIGRSG